MSENAISEISITGKEFMGYVKGHFEYTIKVQYENFKEITAKRRYSEISNLYETLVLKFPGCLIPRIPDKDVFMNLNIDAINKMTSTAKTKIDERTEGLELFFKGIAKNKILRKNKYVLHFFQNKGKLPEYLDDSREDEPLEEYVKFSKEPKTFFSKGKKLVGKVLGYAMNYLGYTEQKQEGKDEKENKIKATEEGGITENDEEFLKQKQKELGEDKEEVNMYNKIISKICFYTAKIINSNEKLLQNKSSSNDNILKIINSCNNNSNELGQFIKKLKEYQKAEKNFIEKDFKDQLKEIKIFNNELEDLLKIYERKKSHLYFLQLLHKQWTEASGTQKEEINKKLEHEIKFIKKLNNDLSEEIMQFKTKEFYIYQKINTFFHKYWINLKEKNKHLKVEEETDSEMNEVEVL
jgi:hypothetical protein